MKRRARLEVSVGNTAEVTHLLTLQASRCHKSAAQAVRCTIAVLQVQRAISRMATGGSTSLRLECSPQGFVPGILEATATGCVYAGHQIQDSEIFYVKIFSRLFHIITNLIIHSHADQTLNLSIHAFIYIDYYQYYVTKNRFGPAKYCRYVLLHPGVD